jgi:hypothetical protein
MMLPHCLYSYKDYKYSLPIIKYLLWSNKYLNEKQRTELSYCLEELKEEQKKICNILGL